jgi:hypothetical protein
MTVLDVRLTEGLFKTSQRTGEAFLLDLDVDRLLAPCYIALDLTPKKPRYGGWESMEIAGHSLGHYLSALSVMYQMTKHEELKTRIDYIVMELADLQQVSGDGYVSGFKRDCFDEVFTGEFRVEPFSLGGSWVPWYSIHKIYQGLIDVYHFTGLNLAKDVLYRLADWAEKGLKHLSDEAFQRMLTCEFGGMNEVFADVYLLTDEPRFLTLAERFQHEVILTPLSQGIDNLAGKHANTQIPKVIGTAKLYQITHKQAYKEAVMFFYQEVIHNRSYAIGGNSIGEHFGPSKTEPLGILTTETCNTYNMMKLASMIFSWDQASHYYDDYERALYNHILASQDPDTGGKTYFVPTEPGHFKVYCDKEESFWCCTGTGMENPVRYGTDIFRQMDDVLYVNLFINAVVTLEDRAIQFKQQTDFPYQDTVSFTVTRGNAVDVSVRIRKPSWLSGPVSLTLNGEKIHPKEENGYMMINRTWYEGDELKFVVPKAIHLYHNKEHHHQVVYMYGPLALAAVLGRDNYPETDIVGDHQLYNHHPLIDVPPLISDKQPSELIHCVDKLTLTFQSEPVAGKAQDVFIFKPFFMVHHERYALYVTVLTKQTYTEHLTRDEEEKKRLINRTVDVVTPGEQQPETDHNFNGVNTRTGYLASVDKHWRDCFDHGFIRYSMRVTDAPLTLRLTYFGSDDNVIVESETYPRVFDILVDGVAIHTEHLQSEAPGQLFTRDYPIPSKLTEGKQTIDITFQAREKTVAGGLYEVRLLTQGDD